MVYWEICKYILMPKMKGVVSQEAGRVVRSNVRKDLDVFPIESLDFILRP